MLKHNVRHNFDRSPSWLAADLAFASLCTVPAPACCSSSALLESATSLVLRFPLSAHCSCGCCVTCCHQHTLQGSADLAGSGSLVCLQAPALYFLPLQRGARPWRVLCLSSLRGLLLIFGAASGRGRWLVSLSPGRRLGIFRMLLAGHTFGGS